jgi:superfamily II RNA helicase
MLVPTLHRAGKMITGEEFANVAGRAGRAFVDVEGLVVHVMHSGDEWRLSEWRKLVDSARSRSLESGLVQIVNSILMKLSRQGVLDREDAFEYLANSRATSSELGWKPDRCRNGCSALSPKQDCL